MVNDEALHSPSGIYIHVPFCKGKCNYCHFYSINSLELIPQYIQALHDEISLCSTSPFTPALASGGEETPDTFDTIYFGGGTPSLLGVRHFETILKTVESHFKIAADAEITVELNPADRDLTWYKTLKPLGINRLNIGIQSFDDPVLRFLGRRHMAADAVAAIEMAVRAGFDNIGLDLIYGIPGQDLASWQRTLEKALSFRPAHLSCYELSVEEGTPLARRYLNGDFSLPDENRQWDFFSRTSKYLEKFGYIHYEVSNFARGTSRISRHNRKYWDHGSYLGLGPAAHSFYHDTRWWNHDSVEMYLQALKSGRRPIAASELLNPEQLRMETIFLGLRTRKGINLNAFQNRYDLDLLTVNPDILGDLIKEGFLFTQNGRLQPTLKGLAVADRLAIMFLEDKKI